MTRPLAILFAIVLAFYTVLIPLASGSPNPTRTTDPNPRLSPRTDPPSIPYQNYVTCWGIVPTPLPVELQLGPTPTAWPEGRSPDDYDNLEELCTPAFRNNGGLGCVCLTPDGDMRCQAIFADFVLWNTGWLRRHCSLHCSCADEESVLEDVATGLSNMIEIDLLISDTVSDLWTSSEIGDCASGSTADCALEGSPGSQVNVARVNNTVVARWTGAPQCQPKASLASSPRCVLPVKAPSISASPPPSAPSSFDPGRAAAIGSSTCSSACSSDNMNCGRTRVGGAACKCIFDTRSGAGPWFSRGSCGIPALGKRQEGETSTFGCACNSTYVSSRCCDDDVEDGLVWEAPHMKLGELRR
ncbi:MAG: hypothetical protein M1817_001904 [Caeruleum heppii]|nr:MAG: hypothetical protein M1817_001904 [Caeruleum heppii]